MDDNKMKCPLCGEELKEVSTGLFECVKCKERFVIYREKDFK